MNVGQEYSVTLVADGTDIPLGITDFTFRVYENASDYLPTAELAIMDHGYTDLPSLCDGMPLRLSWSNLLTEESWSLPLRVFNYAHSPDTDLIEVSCYFDAPDLFKESKFAAYEGVSSMVAQKLAQANGLTYDGDSTEDSQVWLRTGTTGQVFLASLARHAYRNATSVYCATVTRQKVLRYYDLTSRKSQSPKWNFVTAAAGVPPEGQSVAYGPSSLIARSRSGFANAWRGYGIYANRYDMLTGKRQAVTVDQLDKSTDFLSVRSDMATASKSIVGPVGCGNTHDRYFAAAVQNAQNLALFCNEVNFTGGALRDVALLDRVTLVVDNDRQTSLRQPISGVYFIDKIATEITKSRVTVRYNAVREGFNSDHDKTGKGLY